ncbi:MAG: HEAT repeat domain-containing protein [Planctomycetota bacterium]
MTDNPTLVFCPGCQGPLAPEDARRRLVNGSCVACKVEPPDVGPGEILYCSRTGKELEPQDFRTGRAIRVYRRCISLDAVREERVKQKESGEFGCDSCGARLTALDFLTGEARVIDKVVLCPRCRRKKPDPAGNGRTSTHGPHASASPEGGQRGSGRKKAARSSQQPSESTSAAMAAARSRDPHGHANEAGPPTQPMDVVGTESNFPVAVVSAQSPSEAMIGGATVAGVVKASLRGEYSPSDSGVVAAPAAAAQAAPAAAHKPSNGTGGTGGIGGMGVHAHPVHTAHPERAERLPEPDVVPESPAPSMPAPRMLSRAAARRGQPHAYAQSNGGAAHAGAAAMPGSAGRGTWHSPDGVTLELATSRDLRWATGSMVLMVWLLCSVLLVVFLNYQTVNPVLAAKVQLLAEAQERAREREAADRLLLESMRNDLARLLNAPANPVAPPPDWTNRSQPPPNVSHNPGTNTPSGNAPASNAADPANVGDNPVPSNPLPADPTNPDALPDEPMLQALKSDNPARRLEALLEINKLADRRPIPKVIDLAINDPDPYVRAVAIRLLAVFRVKEAGSALQEMASATGQPGIVGDAARQALRDMGLR